ncbi:uncharacterized protein LOC144987305 [Oryzias latipes]
MSNIADRARATLTAATTTVSVGDRVTLICSVEKSAGWKYEWFRRTSHTSEYRMNDGLNGNIRVSQGGIYRCRGFRGEPAVYSDPSDEVTIQITSIMIRSFALRYAMAAGCSKNKACPRGQKNQEVLTVQNTDFHSNREIRVSQGGVYRCRGGRGEPVYSTEISDPVTIVGEFLCVFFLHYQSYQSSVNLWSFFYQNQRCHMKEFGQKHNKVTKNNTISPPEPVLRVSPWWLSPGASVTLSCEVEHVSAGWSFYWYKAVPDLSHKSGSYSYELLPASSNGTADNSYIIHGQTHTAGYVCRAGRGEPHFYTLYSQPHFVWSGGQTSDYFHPSASLSVSPDRVQHFTSDSVSLSCEGNSAEWRVSRFLLPDFLSFCSDWGTMNGSTCHVQKIQSSNAVYWCESGSAFSNAVNITGHCEWKHVWIPIFSLTFIIGLI